MRPCTASKAAGCSLSLFLACICLFGQTRRDERATKRPRTPRSATAMWPLLVALSPLGVWEFEESSPFGQRGAKEGQLVLPNAVAANRGEIIVADTGNSRLEIFSANGQYLRTLSGRGSLAGRLNFPMGIAIDPYRNIAFVADTFNNRVQQLRLSDGGAVGTAITYAAYTTSLLKRPRAVAYASDLWIYGRVHPHTAQKVLFVADTGNNRVAIFVRTGDSLAIHHTLGEYGTADGQFDGPAGMAVHRGLLYVCDSRNDRVQTFVAERAHHSDPIWTHVSTLGSRGTAPGAFMQPAGVSAVDEELVVSEWEGKRVQVLSLTGAPKQVLSAEGGGRLGQAIIFTRHDLDRSASNRPRLVVADRSAHKVHILKQSRTVG